MADKLSNYLKGINYEKVGKYEEAFNIFQNDSSDFSLSKLVIYEYLGLGTDKNYKNSLESLKKIKSNVERKFLASYLLLNEDKKNSIDYVSSLEELANKKNGNANEILGDLYLKGIFVEKNYNEIEEHDVFDYIEYIGEKLRKNSALRKISVIKTFYKFCYLNKVMKKDPTGMVKSLKREHRLPEILTIEEMKRIVDNCPYTPKGMQNRLIIKFLIVTGARISEILNLEIKDVENQEYEFIKVLGKGSKYQIIPIYDSLENEIKNYLAVYRPKLKNANNSFKMFPNTRREKFWKDLKTIAKDTGIEKNVYPHIFRHSLTTILLGNSADICVVQEILGHANITTTEVYTHVEKSKLKMIYNNIKLGDD